jgi:hypothetical protein
MHTHHFSSRGKTENKGFEVKKLAPKVKGWQQALKGLSE